MRGLSLAAAAALCALAGGCRSRPPVIEGLILPIELAGPTCGSGGPGAAIVGARPFRCGKGDTCTSLDLHVQNRAQRPIWLPLDGDRDFSGVLDRAEIIQSGLAPSPPVWKFYGDDINSAVRLPPGADLTLRNIPFFPAIASFRAAFFDRLILEYNQYADGVGDPKWTMPLRGDFDLAWLDGESAAVPALTLEHRERVSLDTWCTLELPVSVTERTSR